MSEYTRPRLTKKAVRAINEMHYGFKCSNRSESLIKCYLEMHRYRGLSVDLKCSLENANKRLDELSEEIDALATGNSDVYSMLLNKEQELYNARKNLKLAQESRNGIADFCFWFALVSMAVNVFLFVGWVL